MLRTTRAPSFPVYPRAVAWPSAVVQRWLRQRLEAAGADPGEAPDISPPRMMRLPEVRRVTGLSVSTIYRLMKDNSFPRPIPIDRAAQNRGQA
jgi:predicted DNA-binding transcriptional regulator AlpA